MRRLTALSPARFAPPVLFALFGLALFANATEDGFPGMETLMSHKDFTEAGLDKLTPEQLAALNAWFDDHLGELTSTPAAAPPSPIAEKADDKDVRLMRSRIAGQFNGWTGDTLFRLENGQVWRQRVDGRYTYRSVSPEVELTKGFFGFWTLTVVETGRRIGVTRLD